MQMTGRAHHEQGHRCVYREEARDIYVRKTRQVSVRRTEGWVVHTVGVASREDRAGRAVRKTAFHWASFV